jgi:hypothetical protein
VRGNLVYFYRFGILYQEKSGNPVTEWSTVADNPGGKRKPKVDWHGFGGGTLIEEARNNHCAVDDMFRRSVNYECRNQDDQIGRIFAHWVIVYFGQY